MYWLFNKFIYDGESSLLKLERCFCKLDVLKVFIISAGFWSLFLYKLVSFENVFLFLAILSVFVFRRPLREGLNFPKYWLFVLIFIFVFLAILPLFLHQTVDSRWVHFLNTRSSSILMFLFVWIIFWQLKPSEDVLWWSLIVSSLVVSFVIVYELFILNDFNKIFTHRFGGLATAQILRYGIFSNLFTIILLGGFLWAIRKGTKVIAVLIIATLLTFVGSLVSDTRSAWAGLPEALIAWSIFYWLYIKRNSVKNVRRAFMLFMFFLISFIIILFYFGDRVEKRWDALVGGVNNYSQGVGHPGSVETRLILFEAGIKGFLEHPVIGVGQDASAQEQQRLTAPIMKKRYGVGEGISETHLHNQFIHEAFVRGGIGLLSLLMTLGYLLYFFGKRVKNNNKVGIFDPWPLAGSLFVVSLSISMFADSTLFLRSGVAYVFFMATFLVFINYTMCNETHPSKS